MIGGGSELLAGPVPEYGPPYGTTGETIDQEARRLVFHGPRQQDYGHPREDFTRIAQIWSAILGTEVTAEQALIMMAGLKLARLSTSFQHHDSKVDVIGYMLCLDRLAGDADS